jgi:hypothetical protein
MKIKDAFVSIILITGIVTSCTKTNPASSGSCSTNIPNPLTDSTQTLHMHDHYLDTASANAMIAKFMAKKDSIRFNSLPGQPEVIPLGESFSRRAIQNLLLQDSCVGININYGLNADDKLVMIISGISSRGHLMNTPAHPCNATSPYKANCVLEIGLWTFKNAQ